MGLSIRPPCDGSAAPRGALLQHNTVQSQASYACYPMSWSGVGKSLAAAMQTKIWARQKPRRGEKGKWPGNNTLLARVAEWLNCALCAYSSMRMRDPFNFLSARRPSRCSGSEFFAGKQPTTPGTCPARHQAGGVAPSSCKRCQIPGGHAASGVWQAENRITCPIFRSVSGPVSSLAPLKNQILNLGLAGSDMCTMV